MKIKLLNHASIIVECGPIKLLCDPWFSGTCFEQGWGLKFFNPQCFDLAMQCTHLWVSHFHGDHFHAETLRELVKLNPKIQVLGNNSFNFQMDDAFRRIGFENVIPLLEREKIKISEDVEIIRYPTTGIDNMLLLEYKGTRLLNYNDCNLSSKALNALIKKIGRVDIVLNNYNHAGKILSCPLPSISEIKDEQKTEFLNKSILFNPRYIIPFASDHYYRAAESLEQNKSLININELSSLDLRIIPMKVGEAIKFDGQLNIVKYYSTASVQENEYGVVAYSNPKTFLELSNSFAKYAEKIQKSFLYLVFWLPVLNIKITDLDLVVSVRLNKSLKIVAESEKYHISATSEALYSWFNKDYGIDGFWVGAHFEINQNSTFPLRWQLLIGLLTENKLDLLSLSKSIFSSSGIKFLWARREEIMAIILNFNFKVGQR